MENEEVTFHCTATGNPTPDITWLKDGKTVGMGDTLSFKAKSEKSGKYWCSADNGLDTTVNTSASLDVQCKYDNSMLPTWIKVIIPGTRLWFFAVTCTSPRPHLQLLHT